MSEYQTLENAILLEFKNKNLQTDPYILDRVEELVDKFNIYWKNYQDTWTQNYWEIYESLHEKMNNSCNINEISDIYADKDNQDKIIFFNDSTLADNFNLEDNLKHRNDDNLIINCNKNFYSRQNQRVNSTNIQTKTLINLHEIDEELAKINDVSVIKEKKQAEKRRNCFDCLVF